ncbi:ATP-binding cassette domain-containing protein [Maribacter algicola]|uniref:ATP-binding cassette domain-containing protein n=1 Tax=Meishania litoralis TaxID=3434685 RepID=A0ACC7LKE3_9FLAO
MILEADNIELNFEGRRILNGIYLKAEIGKVTGILGRNGSGKTCLLRIIFGDLMAKYKNIRIDGQYQSGHLFRTHTTSYLPQHQLLPGDLQIEKAFSWFNVSWQTFTALFETFKTYSNTRVNELSSGEIRIIETYLILMTDKKIILLDEPFSFIAPIYIEKFKQLISAIKKNALIIITDHFYRDILEVSDNVYFLKNGNSKPIRSKKDLESEGYLNSSSEER